MIQPADIRRKAERLYREYVRAWLMGDEQFFPKDIRSSKAINAGDLSAARRAIRALREASKDVSGSGYAIEWRDVNSRKFGRNSVPDRIYFESADDLLTFVGRKNEFATLKETATRLRQQCPELESWIRSHPDALIRIAPSLDSLSAVVTYFQHNHRPHRFARELPIPVHTKFIKEHESILIAWLNLILPAHAIRADESSFERRFGLRCAQRHLLIRLLDPQLQDELRFPCDEFSLPVEAISRLDGRACRVIIVENQINLLTLPPQPRGFALGGLGYGVTMLKEVHWLQRVPMWYWGDIDVDGFAILSLLRGQFPHVRSFLMDCVTFERFREFAACGTGRTCETPPYLTDPERALFHVCREENLRLEQERIPQSEVDCGLLKNPIADDSTYE